MASTIRSSWQTPAWSERVSEDLGDVDEPPEVQSQRPTAQQFRRTAIRRPSEQYSLLTKAIMTNHEDDDRNKEHRITGVHTRERRRSMTSNISQASTADLTSDTGLTSPSRTNTPSPPAPEMSMLHLNGEEPHKNVSLANAVQVEAISSNVPDLLEAPKAAPRKRCIQFACAAKPMAEQPNAPRPPAMQKTPSAQEAPRRPCIKFVCPTRPASTQNTPPKQSDSQAPQRATLKPTSPVTPKKSSNLSATTSISPRRSPMRKSPNRATTARPKFLRANSSGFGDDGAHFHAFACEEKREEDWIRRESTTSQAKITINDTLTKENDFRRLAVEAEEEAEQEEQDEEDALDEEDLDDDDDEDDDEDEDEEDDDDQDEVETVDQDHYDGYSTDEETGFAESDDSGDEDENMALWTLGTRAQSLQTASVTPVMRRPTLHETHSDESTATNSSDGRGRRAKPQRIKLPPEPVDLPDSTDFVCGTLDEDRPLEEAYLSNVVARRNEKLRVIPQDIDPSFPASDPDDDDGEEMFNPVHHSSDDENGLMQGKMEDLHHGQDRSRRRRKSEQPSPRKYHSPPPRRHLSPPPKTRARSPKPLFGRPSPRRMRSPPTILLRTPTGSPRKDGHVNFNLAGRPGLTDTKSLPRPAAMFMNKHIRGQRPQQDDDAHVRGAIDIVKGLEKKRLRRKEKFHQKYCNRARRGQIPERKPLPGQGAERMKELGLLMAGKKDQGNYVISI